MKEKEVLPSILLSGNSLLMFSFSPLLMLQDTKISSKIWLPEHLKLIAPYSWLLPQQENLKPVSQLTDKLENMVSWPSLSESNKWLSESTKWMPLTQNSLNLDIMKSKKNCQPILKKSVIKLIIFLSYLSPVSKEITWLKNLQIWDGITKTKNIQVSPSKKHWIKLPHHPDQLIKLWDFHYRMYTKLEVLEQSQSEESKPVSLNQEPMLLSLHLKLPLMLNPSKCITKVYQKLSQVTMLDSTLKIFPLKILKEDLLPLIPKMTQQENVLTSLLKLLFSITLVKSKPDIPLSWIATPPTLLVNSLNWNKKLIEDLEKN